MKLGDPLHAAAAASSAKVPHETREFIERFVRHKLGLQLSQRARSLATTALRTGVVKAPL